MREEKSYQLLKIQKCEEQITDQKVYEFIYLLATLLEAGCAVASIVAALKSPEMRIPAVGIAEVCLAITYGHFADGAITKRRLLEKEKEDLIFDMKYAEEKESELRRF